MRYGAVGPGRRFELPAPAEQGFAVQSCGLAMCRGMPCAEGRAGWHRQRGGGQGRKRKGLGGIEKGWRKGGNNRRRVCWAEATETGERLHLSTISHKSYFPADSREELIPIPALAPIRSFRAPGGIDFGDVPLPAGLCRLRTRRAGDSLMWQVWHGMRTGSSRARCPAARCRAGACGAGSGTRQVLPASRRWRFTVSRLVWWLGRQRHPGKALSLPLCTQPRGHSDGLREWRGSSLELLAGTSSGAVSGPELAERNPIHAPRAAPTVPSVRAAPLCLAAPGIPAAAQPASALTPGSCPPNQVLPYGIQMLEEDGEFT